MSSPWMPDGALYLADLRHPIIAEEYRHWMAATGRRFDEGMTPRERRQFDRDMVLRYGRRFPPPPRAEWALLSYDIQDEMEERAARIEAPVELVTVYVDEDLLMPEEVAECG